MENGNKRKLDDFVSIEVEDNGQLWTIRVDVPYDDPWFICSTSAFDWLDRLLCRGKLKKALNASNTDTSLEKVWETIDEMREKLKS